MSGSRFICMNSPRLIAVRLQLVGMSNYVEREVKRRAFVVERWEFREKEKTELDLEAKLKAGVRTLLS